MLASVLVLGMMQLPPQLNTGAYLYESCKAAVRLWDGENSQDMTRVSDCLAYFAGFEDGHSAGKDRVYCAGKAKMGTVVRVYLDFMDKHPKLFDYDRNVGVTWAFVNTYPCHASTLKK